MQFDSDIARLGPWFHNLHLPGGEQTAPDHWLGDFPAFKWRKIAEKIPQNLENWSVLDIGCNAGFYSFELARRGAAVLGIDVDEHYLAQARWGAETLRLGDRVRFHRMQVYDLAHVMGQFDLVLFLGVFYHLRYPLLGLDIAAQKARRMLVFQTLSLPESEKTISDGDCRYEDRDRLQAPGWPKMSFVEGSFAGDPTNWWIPNSSCVEALLRSAGLKVDEALPDEEIYLCSVDSEHPSCAVTWNADEFISATGIARTSQPIAREDIERQNRCPRR